MSFFARSGKVDLQEMEIEIIIDEQIQTKQLETILASLRDLLPEDDCEFIKHFLNFLIEVLLEVQSLFPENKFKDLLWQKYRICQAFIFELEFILRIIGEMFLLIIKTDCLERVRFVTESSVELLMIEQACFRAANEKNPDSYVEFTTFDH
jgi:hypothetical protein